MSQRYLVIVESPSKCEKIKSFLTSTDKYKNSIVVATCGHFREIKSICPKDFSIKYEIMSRSKKYITQIKKLASVKNTKVILATDWDREGEAIAFHICAILKLPITKTERIRFGEITKKVFLDAMENPFSIDKHLVDAQQARQVIDRWIGFHFSPLLWKQFPKYRGLSAGRCQTPTLKILYNQEQKMKTISSETEFQIFGTFEEEVFKLNGSFSSEKTAKEFLDKNISFQHRIKSVATKKVYEYPGLPFCTSSLQKYCNTTFGWSPSVTMSKAQQLYEKGLITYHRTESQKISHHFQKEMLCHLEEKYGKEYCNQTIIEKQDNNKNNLPHEAIRITSVDTNVLNDPLYNAILKRSLQSVMTNACFDQMTIQISSPDTKYIFEKKYKNNTFLGFLILNQHKEQNKEKSKEWNKNSLVLLNKLEAKENLIKCIKHFSEGSVISNLEQLGIGRPSTFASFVSKIQEKNYAEKKSKSISTGIFLKEITYHVKKKEYTMKQEEFIKEETSKLFLTELGEKVVSYLYDRCPTYFDFQYTSLLETKLDLIAKGKLKYKKLLEEVQKDLNEPI
jgi:DNA topoisomerase-1